MAKGNTRNNSDRLVVQMHSTAGAKHAQPGKPGHANNQDAIAKVEYNNRVIGGVICDGCSGSNHTQELFSHIGARIGADNVADLVQKQLEKTNGKSVNWSEVTDELLVILKNAAKVLAAGEDFNKTVQDYLYFTIVVGVVINNRFVVAVCGDGMYLIDDEVHVIEPPVLTFEENGKIINRSNVPPCISYNLVPSPYDNQQKDLLRIHEVCNIPVRRIKKTALVGSDGFVDLARVALSDIHDVLFMSLNKQRPVLVDWLERHVFTGKSARMLDDVSIVAIRRATVQERLLAKRAKEEEPKALKKKLAKVSRELAKVKAELAKEKARPTYNYGSYTGGYTQQPARAATAVGKTVANSVTTKTTATGATGRKSTTGTGVQPFKPYVRRANTAGVTGNTSASGVQPFKSDATKTNTRGIKKPPVVNTSAQSNGANGVQSTKTTVSSVSGLSENLMARNAKGGGISIIDAVTQRLVFAINEEKVLNLKEYFSIMPENFLSSLGCSVKYVLLRMQDSPYKKGNMTKIWNALGFVPDEFLSEEGKNLKYVCSIQDSDIEFEQSSR